MSYLGHSSVGVLPLSRNAVGLFCSPSRLSHFSNCQRHQPDYLETYLKQLNFITTCSHEDNEPWKTVNISSSTDIQRMLFVGFANGFEYGLGILSFGPIWPCLIVEALAIWAKFHVLSYYCIVINCAVTCSTVYFLCFFRGVMAHSELMNGKFPN